MSQGLAIGHPHAAGIDIGDREIAVAVRSKEDLGYEVSTFSTFNRDLDSIIKCLRHHGITTSAMESTGVY